MAVVTPTPSDEEDKPLRESLTLPILLIDRIRKSAIEAETSKQECLDILNQVEKLSPLLGAAVRLTSSTPPHLLYSRPFPSILSDLSRTLDRCLSLLRRCRPAPSLLHHLFSISSSADFKKLSSLLDSSLADLHWLLSIFSSEGNNLTLPPFATNNDPTIAMVWSSIASLMIASKVQDRIDSVNYLTSLAESSDRNKKMIVEEGVLAPLLKLLKDGGGSAEAQIAAANAISAIADDAERTEAVRKELGVPVIVHALANSPMKVQIVVSALVAKMAKADEKCREEFGKENVLKPIVSCLMMDLVLGDHKTPKASSFHSIVQINKESAKINPRFQSGSEGSSSGGGKETKEGENESPEVKKKLKIKCALALWRLCSGSLLNSRKIAEGRGLQCLSKIIESEKEELLYYCLMTVTEIAEVAEANTEFRRAAWKPNLPPVKAMLDQLLRVIKEEADECQIPAVKAVGCLARTFSAKETRIIGTLVTQLRNKNVKVAIEAAVALGKFVCTDNYNRVDHSKAIIECDGVSLVMKMLKANERARMHGLVLLCYLSLNVGNSKALEEARALHYLESLPARSVVAANPSLRDLYIKAVHHLKLYQVGGLGAHPHAHNYFMV